MSSINHGCSNGCAECSDNARFRTCLHLHPSIIACVLGKQDSGQIEPTTLLGHVVEVCVSSAWGCAEMTCSFFVCVLSLSCAGMRVSMHDMCLAI